MRFPLSPWPTASGTLGLFMTQLEKHTTRMKLWMIKIMKRLWKGWTRSLLPQDNAEDILDEYVLVDEDVPTSAELTDNELVEAVCSEAPQDIPAGSDEDEDDMEIVKPSYREVAKALSILKVYLLFISGNQPLMTGLKNIEDAVQIDRQRCMKQATLTDMFRKSM